MSRRLLVAAPALVPTLVAIGLCRVPGFDLLDYHACLVLAPVIGIMAAHLQIGRAPWAAWLVLLAGPLCVYLGNALWVPNCAPWTGVVFYLLGPTTSALVGACLGAIAAGLSRGAPRRLAWVIAVASMVPAAAHFLHHPQVFAYHGLVGWVGGAIYEDALAPQLTYFWFRLADSASWLTAAAIVGGAARHSGLTTRYVGVWGALHYVRRSTVGRVAGLTLLTALAVGSLLGPTLGWRISQGDIDHRLSARIELYLADVRPLDTDVQAGGPALPERPGDATAPDVVVHLMARAGWRRRAALIAEDVAVRWLELRAHFGQAPATTIDVYLYPDAVRKQRWMGAARVEMAKPWLRQVHMVWPGWGRSITRHELAHVFAGVDAPPPFAVPMRHGVWPDALLIEGMAVAAEWPIRAGLDPHHWSAAMRRLKLAPPMARLLAPTGFFGESSARAYTLAGSLLRWLRATYGAAALRRAYRDGDLAAATGRPLPALLAEWGAFVDGLPLRARDLARARARFERSGLFYRPCSLEIGRCRERARRAWRADDSATALREWAALRAEIAAHARRRSLGLDIELSYAYALGRDDRLAAAQATLTRQLSGKRRLTALQRARLQRLRGDLAVAAGDLRPDGDADRAWRAAAMAPLANGAQRMLTVKQHLLRQGAGGAALVRDALSDFGATVSFGRALRRARRALPHDPIITYLWARRRLLGGAAGRAVEELRRVRPRLVAWPRLQRETDHMLAQYAARRGDCAAVGRAAARAGSLRADVIGWRAALKRRCDAMRRLSTARWVQLVGPRT